MRTDIRGNPMATSTNYLKSYSQVPTLSLKAYTEGEASDRQHFVNELFNALKYYGFIILKDHGIESKLLDQAYSQLETLFALSVEDKMSYISKVGGNQRGYTPFGKEHAKN